MPPKFPSKQEREQMIKDLTKKGEGLTANEHYKNYIDSLRKLNTMMDHYYAADADGNEQPLEENGKNKLTQAILDTANFGELFLADVQRQGGKLTTGTPDLVGRVQDMMSQDYEMLSLYDPENMEMTLPEIQQDEHEAHGSEGEGDDLAREAEGLREAERDEADDEVEGDQNGEDDARDSAALGVQEPVHHDAVSQRRRDEEHGEEHLSPGMAVERREAEGDGARDGADAEGEEIRDRGLAREEREHAGEDDEIEHWERRSDLHDAHGEIRAGELAAIVNAEFHCRTSSSVRRR